MSWLMKSKKFRIGLVFGLILFVFLSIANIALAQMQPVYMGQEVTVQPITDLQAAERAVEAARLRLLLYDFSPRATWDWLRGNPNPAQQELDEALEARTEAYVRQHGQASIEAAQNAGVQADSVEALRVQIEENAKEAGAAVARNNQQFSNTVTIGEIIARMFAWILYYIAVGLGWILILITSVMLKIATYNNFLREGMVQTGWQIVRDICNNFFIILLLITAISTMLRQGEFKDWRGMLPKILVAAVVINFSLLMCGIFIDVSQIFTLTFASPLNSITGYNVILAAMGIPSGMQLSKLLTAKENSLETTVRVETIDLIAALFYAVVTTFVTIVVVVAVTVILAYRIIWLWFLVILSPLPILLAIFKKGASYASQWWGEFTKYLIVGPVIMFFLYLSFMAMGQMDNTGSGGNSSNVLGVKSDEWSGETTIGNDSSVTLTAGKDTVSLSNAASPDGLINFLIIIGLMVGSLMMAQKMGVGGSKFAGQSLGWLQKQGKRFTVGAAKSTSKGLATAVDDRLGARQKLYGAAFAAGGKFIPFAGQALGKRIGELEAGTQKRTSTKYGDLAKGYKVDDMNEAQLRKLASKGGARGVVAAQTLMKKGLLRDDDDLNRANNVEIIRNARNALKGTDLGNTFDENLKKYNPGLAYSTVYDGKLEKLRNDLKTGKINVDKLMASMSPEQINKLKADLGGGKGAVAKFLMDNSDDIGKTIKGMKKESRELVTNEIDHKTFAKRMNADGTVAEYDDEARKKLLSSRSADTMKVFDMDNAEQAEKARKQFSKNRESILKEMDPEAMNAEFIKNFGDLFSSKELEKNFSDRSAEHKSAAAAALQGHLDASLSALSFDQLSQNLARAIANGDEVAIASAKKDQADMDELVKKNLLVQGKISQPVIDAPGSSEAMKRILGNLSGDDASKIKWGKLSDQEKNIISQNINPNALKSLATRGDNNELVRGVRENVKAAATTDNTNEQIFNNAKQNHANAKKKLDDLLAQLRRLDDEADDLAAAGNAAESNLRRVQANRIRSSGDLARLTGEENSANIAYTDAKRRNLGGGDNWVRTDAQKREAEIKSKRRLI
ncbi:MAG: hypothetical protein BWY53_00783 [Parcubacteria group bacterium ADurb.Bin326]|nr:MAG: hypothetical protein BWY53_00783 [Parcubacteria group bacterium ADurb.Bin326]